MPGKIIAIHTSKGGMGKSTLTVVLASYLAYVHQKRVIVFDCDPPQHSIADLREEEETTQSLLHQTYQLVSTNDLATMPQPYTSANDQAAFERYRHNRQVGLTETYPVHALPFSALQELDMDRIRDDFDYIFLDMGGQFNAGILRALAETDMLLVPFTTQQVDVTASIQYVGAILDYVLNRQLPDYLTIRCVWNKYKFTFARRADALEAYLAGVFKNEVLPVAFLKTRLNDADAGFDRAKMLTTISSPVLLPAGRYVRKRYDSQPAEWREAQYLQDIVNLIDEIRALLPDTVSTTRR
ncbi:cellulose biosynthesis protein BcsQ [Spirosoma lacussanchae]|uniref:ParA family protein n=1 Tax=Spirosoma lacussanchae TaxID=1884249 RepID=UPI001109704E|nr:AAA family ATPase [Spirosoma lacussanchae]